MNDRALARIAAIDDAALGAAPLPLAAGPDLFSDTPRLLLRHWRQAGLALALAGALGIGASYLVTPQFTSTTTFLPPQQGQQGNASSALASLGALAGLAGAAGGVKSPVDQYVSLMKSSTVSDRVIAKFELMKVYETEFHEQARKTLAKRVQISAGKKDNLITVAVDDTDPARAAAIANHYVDELRKVTATLALTEAQQRRVFFEQRLQETRQKLTEAQRALQDTGFSAGALRVEPKAAGDGYARLRAQRVEAEIRLQIMRRDMADSSVEVQQLQATLQALDAQLRQMENISLPKTGGADYIARYRDFKYQETLFDLLARQYELARVDEGREGGLIQVVDAAQPAERKSWPSRLLFGATGAALGLLACGLWLFSRERLRRSAG